MKTIVNYALLGKSETERYELNRDEVWSFILKTTEINFPECIYLVCINDEIIITENRGFVEELFNVNTMLNSVYPFYEEEEITIQEYATYEDAYKVALDMREPNAKCYN